MLKKIVFTLCFVCIGLSAQTVNVGVQQNDLPEIGVVASNAMSINREMAIGDVYMRQLRAQAPLINDPLLEEYIQDIGNRLVSQANDVKFPFAFFLLNSNDINAFAFFGGHIGVHSGLILAADNESELASVLSHEITHVTQRHLARRIESSQNSSPLQIASLIGGLLLAVVNPEVGMAAITVGSAAGQQAAINYTRSNEKEADRLGMQILSKAGFDTRAAATFFGKLAERYRFKSKPPAFLLSHPLPESRIADARARADLYYTPTLAPSLAFSLAKSRLIARYTDNDDSNEYYFSQLMKNTNAVMQAAGRYGLTLMQLKKKQFDQAKATLQPLIDQYPGNLFFVDTATDIFVEQDQFTEAVAMLDPLLAHTPRNRVLVLNMANALIQLKQFDRAILMLKDYLLLNPTHTLSLNLLTDAYAENQQKLEMHQTRAEYYALLSIYPKAIDELQNAYNYANDKNLEKQRIRARIEQFREADRKLKAL
ncbi:M48 family metalloprotease [Alteromonadaceae bacterium BrNp21-10]|nr:M48 family metalloprotease [Alteromonadaceae bacterium BrNp21-10]